MGDAFDQQMVYGVQVIALVLTIGFFLTGSATALKIHQQKSVKNVNFLPFLMTSLNCFLWCSYGILKRDMLLCVVNTCGCITQAFYMFIFLQNCDNKKLYLKQVGYVGCIAGIILLLVNFNNSMMDSTVMLGFIASTVTVCMFGSPLSTMRTVISTRNAETISFPLSVMTVLTSGIWFLYGYMLHDQFVQVPNFLGCILGSSQIYLVQKYKTVTVRGDMV